MAGRGPALQQVPVKSKNKDHAATKSSAVGCILLRREGLFPVWEGEVLEVLQPRRVGGGREGKLSSPALSCCFKI